MGAPKKKTETTFQSSGDAKCIIPLNRGTWAYIFASDGRLHHVKRDSDEMVQYCKDADEHMRGKASRDLKRLGWKDVLEKMNDQD